jgi:hypothetical protein
MAGPGTLGGFGSVGGALAVKSARTTIEYPCVSVAGVAALSAACNVKLKDPLAVGVPCKRQRAGAPTPSGATAIPGGSAPDCSVQLAIVPDPPVVAMDAS